jgi:hypothetical protein
VATWLSVARSLYLLTPFSYFYLLFSIQSTRSLYHLKSFRLSSLFLSNPSRHKPSIEQLALSLWIKYSARPAPHIFSSEKRKTPKKNFQERNIVTNNHNTKYKKKEQKLQKEQKKCSLSTYSWPSARLELAPPRSSLDNSHRTSFASLILNQTLAS